MVDFLKRSKPEGEKWEEDEKVRKSVEEILNNICLLYTSDAADE